MRTPRPTVRPILTALACAALAFLAALGFAAAANASPVGAWQLPGTQLSGSPASDSQIITTSDGSTVIAWLEGGEGGTITTVTRPAGGAFGPAVTVPGTGSGVTGSGAVGSGVKGLALSSAPDGTVWIGWIENSASAGSVGPARIYQTIAAVSRPPGGSFGAVQTVASNVASAQTLRLAFSPDSSKVFVAWIDSPGGVSRAARAAVKVGANPFGAVEQPMPEIQDINDFYLNVIQTGIAAGTAVITAQHYDPVVDGEQVVSVTRAPAAESFGAVDSVSGTAESARLTPPQISATGALTVAFASLTSPSRIQSATLAPGSAQFSDPINASDTATAATFPTLAVSPSGRIAISYVNSVTIPMPRSEAAVAIKSAEGNSYVQKFPSGNITENESFSGATVAIGPDDRVTLGWTSPYDYYGPGTARSELTSTEDSNGNFLAGVEISARGTTASGLSLRFTPDGELTALWVTAYAEIFTASRAAGADPSAAFSSPLTLTTSGTPTGFTISPTGMESIIWSDEANVISFASTASARRHLTITKAGTGTGTVTSAPAGIDCGATCEADFNEGLSVTLTATPADGSTFTGWTTGCPPAGDLSVSCARITSEAAACNDSSPTCTINADYDRFITATFAVTPTPTPTPSNNFRLTAAGATNSSLSSFITTTDPGVASQRGTFNKPSGGASSAKLLIACTASKKITKAGRHKLSCKLSSAIRSARRRGAVRVLLRTTFTPTGGAARTVTRIVTLKKTSSGVTG